MKYMFSYDKSHNQMKLVKGLLIYYVRKIFRKTNISFPVTRTPTCAYQGVRNVSFSEILHTY